jgi:imidazoleglycerol phosphate synthase glutamine amidotransferase subunit HisH
LLVKKCCKGKEKYFVTYDCGTSEEKWLVCNSHFKKESFQKYIKEKEIVGGKDHPQKDKKKLPPFTAGDLT